MNTRITILSLMLIGVVTAHAQSPAYPSTVSAVVQGYCKADAEGAGLSSQTMDKSWRFTSWEDGPGWDTVVLIAGYKILSVDQKEKDATVQVAYTVIGDLTPDALEEKRHDEKVLFELAKRDRRWKIQGPQLPPHISVQTAVTHFQDLAEHERDPERSEQIRKTVAKIKAVR